MSSIVNIPYFFSDTTRSATFWRLPHPTAASMSSRALCPGTSPEFSDTPVRTRVSYLNCTLEHSHNMKYSIFRGITSDVMARGSGVPQDIRGVSLYRENDSAPLEIVVTARIASKNYQSESFTRFLYFRLPNTILSGNCTILRVFCNRRRGLKTSTRSS